MLADTFLWEKFDPHWTEIEYKCGGAGEKHK
jgi:hypothetical protein